MIDMMTAQYYYKNGGKIMRQGKKRITIYLDEKQDADIIELLCKDGITTTIRKALRVYDLGQKLYPDIQAEEECIEGVPFVGGYPDEA